MSKVTGRIVVGAQIRAARSLLGWSQDRAAARLRTNYGYRHREPYDFENL